MPPKRAPKLSRAASPASVGGDSESVISELSSDLGDTLSLSDSAAVLETALTKLLDRRASTRMEALETFNRQLAYQLHNTFLEKELAAIRSGLLASLKRGAPDELIQACRFLELIVITLGSEADIVIRDVIPVLKPLWRHGDPQVQPAAIRALSTIQLMTCHHEDALQHWMASFARCFRRKDSAVAAACIDAWASLATKLTPGNLSGLIFRLYAGRLAVLLHSQSVDVRTSAGEALALLFEAVWQQRRSDNDLDDDDDSGKSDDDNDNDYEDDSESSDAEDAAGAQDDSNLESDDDDDLNVDELHDLLAQLATDGTRSRGRKERSLQRSVFRSVEATVRQGDAPKVTLKIGKERLVFATWMVIIRLAAMRDVLAQGFQRHISSNNLVADLLRVPGANADSIVEAQEAYPESVSVHAKDTSQAKAKVRQQKKKADRNQKHSLRFSSD